MGYNADMFRKAFVIFLIIFCIGVPVSAKVIITEVMYDLSENDNGREWVELYNNGNESIDLSDWWFYENGNHGFQNAGNMTLAAGSYAIIADDPALFSADNPSVNVLMLDSSSFSLRNTGETIALRDADKQDIDTLVRF